MLGDLVLALRSKGSQSLGGSRSDYDVDRPGVTGGSGMMVQSNPILIDLSYPLREKQRFPH